ncbi:MAG: hypothetical protein IH949_11695 [Bacteroidetes bacterium]|nr:hypothetical protein [Bacteroidota bacterium]
MEKIKLKINEVRKVDGWNTDPVGFPFIYKEKLFRAISNNYHNEIKYLFESGAITELNEKKLIPFTKISEYEMEDYELILEHQIISPITYSTEWSFEMCKDAALTIIRLNKILFKYGYETKDAHNQNILFDKYYPQFIDIGSFIKRKNNKYWQCKDELKIFFLYPLKMWSNGNIQLARKSLSETADYLHRYEYLLYKYSFLRIFPTRFIIKYCYLTEVIRNLSKFDLDKIFIAKNASLKRKILKFIHKISLFGLLPHNSVNFNKYEKKINKIKKPNISTLWDSYYKNIKNNKELFKPCSRFDIIIQFIKEFHIEEVFEIGGNQGILAFEISKIVKKIVCSDYDDNAVDIMYKSAKKQHYNITPVLFDILHPIYLCQNYADSFKPQIRFKSQTVLALALSHHLLLGQKVPIEFMFETIIKYTKEYLFIEFMPNGIDRSGVPEWYNVDWFRHHFLNYFELLVERYIVTDSIRILFIGRKI